MWRWARRWADWVRNEALPLARVRRGGHAVVVRYDAAGQTRGDLPVPWTADAVTVEVLLSLPPQVRRKSDFSLHLPILGPFPAETVRPDAGDRHRVVFRFPVPPTSVVGELRWKSRPVAPVVVPVLTADEFLTGFVLAAPAAAVRLGGGTAAARMFPADGCKGLVATAVLRSPHGLGPAEDLGLSVVFRSERTGRAFDIAVPLTAEQRSATEAVVSAACPRVPRRPGGWTVAWRIGDRELATRRVEAIPAARFEASVRVLDTRFAVAEKGGAVRVVRQPPSPGTAEAVGPCFLLASSEPGAAGVCNLIVFAVTPGDPRPAQLLDRDVLVTDAPTVFSPGLLSGADLARVGGFELRLNGRVLGAVSLSPVPPAALTAEGGYKPPPDFAWTAAAEEELLDRLGRLGPPAG